MPPPIPNITAQEKIWRRQISDRLRAATPRPNANSSLAFTTNGFTQIPKRSRKGRTKTEISIPEWSASINGYKKGDLVCRTIGTSERALSADELGPSFENLNPVPADDGTMLGIWQANEDVAHGDSGPSLYNSKWRLLTPIATEKLVLRKNYSDDPESESDTGKITLNVGRKPHVHIYDIDPDKAQKEAENAAYVRHVEAIIEQSLQGTITLSTQHLNGLDIKFRQVSICYQGQRWYCLMLMSKLYQTPLSNSALDPIT